MTKTEAAALRHAAEWLRYACSPQAALDARADKVRRAASDRAARHLPACSLTKCCPACPRLRCE